MAGGWRGNTGCVSCVGGEVGVLESRRGCVSGSGLMTTTVSSVTMLSSPTPPHEVVESKVSFPRSVGEDGRSELSVGMTPGPSSSSEITICPSRAGVKCASVVVGTSGLLSLSNRYLRAVATPAVIGEVGIADIAVCSSGELREPKVARRRGDRTSRSRGVGRLIMTSCPKLGRCPGRGIGGGASIDPFENLDILDAIENLEYR